MTTDTMRMIDSTLLQSLIHIAEHLKDRTQWSDSIIANAKACPVLHAHHTPTGTYWTPDFQEGEPSGANRSEGTSKTQLIYAAGGGGGVGDAFKASHAEDIARCIHALIVAREQQDNARVQPSHYAYQDAMDAVTACHADLVEALKKVLK